MKYHLLLSTIVGTCSALAASPSPTTTSYKLKYFDARGAAETCRLLFALADQEYDDARYELIPGKMESPSFLEAKKSGDLRMNLDRAPVLELTPEGVTIGQSKAIERFLAHRFGFMGSTDVEAAFIDCIAEHCRDVKDAQMRKRFSMFVKDGSEEEKKKDEKEWFDVDMPAMLAKIEACIKQGSSTNGYAIGSSISYADICIYSLLKEPFPIFKEATIQAAQDCPLLMGICENVSSHSKISAWIENRPASNF